MLGSVTNGVCSGVLVFKVQSVEKLLKIVEKLGVLDSYRGRIMLGVSNGGVLFGGGLFLDVASGVGWMCRGRYETTYPLQGALKGGAVVRLLLVTGCLLYPSSPLY